MEDMRQTAVRRVGHGAEMLPALARSGVRRLRRRRRSPAPQSTSWQATTALGQLSVEHDEVLLDGAPAGRLTCRIDAGTSTAECSSTTIGSLTDAVVGLVVASVSSQVRRIAWFVPVDDTSLESVLTGAGFACEGWAAPPIGDSRQHRQWALLTGTG